MNALSGKVCIITGGAGSLGEATARLFLTEGARVMLVDLREENLERAAAALNSADVAICKADVTRPDDPAAAVAPTVKR
jgi:NAD(P)-dependent dehydrogenase (short-subunit alcohol dehydrogenase family)